jgi:hemerythrin
VGDIYVPRFNGWLKKHIIGVDKQYSDFLNSKGVA